MKAKLDEVLSPSDGSRLRPSRVQSVVSSQGSLDSDMLGKFSLELQCSHIFANWT